MENKDLVSNENEVDDRGQIYEIEKILADFFGAPQVHRVINVILTSKGGFESSGISGDKSSIYGLRDMKDALIQPEKERLFSNEKDDRLTCEMVCECIISACVQIQSDPVLYNEKEDARSTQLRDILRINGIFVSDQTRHGHAKDSSNPGEVDLMVMKNTKDPLTIIEAMNINSVNRGYIQGHLNKLLDDYNPNGLQELFLVGYVQKAKKHFQAFWARYIEFITGTNAGRFLFESIEEYETNMFFIKHAVVEYSCDGAIFKVHHICMRAGD